MAARCRTIGDSMLPLVTSALEDIILRSAPKHEPSLMAPRTFKELKEWSKSHVLGHDILPVYDGRCDNNIFSSPKVALAFRAWVDAIHIKFNFDNKTNGEFQTAFRIQQECRALGATNNKDLGAVYHIITAPYMYYRIHKKYVADPRKLILHSIAGQGINSYRE